MSKDKVTPLFPNIPPALPMKTVVAKMREDQEAMMEYFTIIAVLTRHKYLELRKQGFDAMEALTLCQNLFQK